MQSITFLEDPRIISEIDEEARKRGTDRSALIREAIREKLKKINESYPEKARSAQLNE